MKKTAYIQQAGTGPITRGAEIARDYERRPFLQGLISGTKGALMGASLGALINAIRGKDIRSGAALGAIGLGTGMAASQAIARKLQNIDQEASLRYHAGNIREREPFFFMPPTPQFKRMFTSLHEEAHAESPKRGLELYAFPPEN